MIPIKIECACGQRYAFDVEPVEGRMPTEVACPTCGAEGTEAANAVIAQSLAPPLPRVTAPVRVAPLRATAAAPPAPPTAPPTATLAPAPASGTRGAAARFGKIDRTQAEHEARAKMSWGDSPEQVTQFLLMQGFTNEEAKGLARSLFDERARAIRANGVKKIVTGAGLVCVPIIAVVIFLSMKVLPMQLLGAAVAVGVWGAWRILKGTFMVLSPKSEPGDVAEQ